MALVPGVTRHPDGRSGSRNDRFEREYTVRYTVVTAYPTVSELTILSDPRIPRPYSIFISSDGRVDRRSWCRSVAANVRPSAPRVWDVVAQYSSKIERPDMQAQTPTLRPPEIAWDNETVSYPLEYDIYGNPVRSTAEGRFDPGIDGEEEWRVVRVKKNFPAAFNPRFFDPYVGAVNSKPWFGYKAGYMRCRKITTRTAFEGIFFYEVNAEFVTRPLRLPRGNLIVYQDKGKTSNKAADVEPWDKIVLDQDLYKKQQRTVAGGSVGCGCSAGTVLKFEMTAAGEPYDGPYELTYRDGCTWATTFGGNGGDQPAEADITTTGLVTIKVGGVPGDPAAWAATYEGTGFDCASGGTFTLTEIGGETGSFVVTLDVTTEDGGGTGDADAGCGPAGWQRVPIYDQRGLGPVTTPWPLDGKGGQLGLCATLNWLVFRTRNRLDFKKLAIL